MTTNLKLISITFMLLIMLVITIFVKKNKITVKYSIVWYLSCLVLIVLILFPSLLSWITKAFGVQLASNFIFALLIGLLVIISISLTIIVSEQKEQIRTLIQEMSILKQNKNK